MTTFNKTKSFDGYHVYENGNRVGVVRKVENWTVRGTRIVWQAFVKKSYKGEATTRKEAVSLLVK